MQGLYPNYVSTIRYGSRPASRSLGTHLADVVSIQVSLLDKKSRIEASTGFLTVTATRLLSWSDERSHLKRQHEAFSSNCICIAAKQLPSLDLL